MLPKSGSVKFTAFSALISCAVIIITGVIGSNMIKSYSISGYSGVASDINNGVGSKINIYFSFLSEADLSSADKTAVLIKNVLLNDDTAVSAVLFSKTSDENYFRASKLIKLSSENRFLFKEGDVIRDFNEENYLKKGIYGPAVDENIYSDGKDKYINAYCPVKIKKRDYVLKTTFSAEYYVNKSVEIAADSEKKRLILILTAISASVLLLVSLLVQITQMNHFYRKLSGVVQDVSSGGSIVKIDPFADKDIHELALSFNNLMEEIEEKDKQISELASKDSLPEIFKFGVDLIKENRIDEAENVFSTLVLLKPGAFASTFNLGVVLAKKKKYSEALNIFYKAAEINPSHGMTVQYISKIEKMFTNGKS